MASIFDGMTGPLNAILGDPVTITTTAGTFAVRGILRNERVEVATEEGEVVLSVLPILRLRLGDTNGLVAGDLVQAADGTQYTVSHIDPSQSPASDRFEVFILRKVIP